VTGSNNIPPRQAGQAAATRRFAWRNRLPPGRSRPGQGSPRLEFVYPFSL